jgi:DNA polymerase III subunit delta'
MKLPWLIELHSRLATAVAEQKLGHAPLLAGPEGLGKAALAEALYRRMLCLSPAGESACGKCRACQLLDSGSHPDFFRVGIPEDKKEIPVDSVRELTASLQLTPSMGPNRVGLVEVAEAMNANAANALLKTLEEPSDNAWLILVTHHPARLPATIRSRCQQIVVRPPERAMALAWLAERCPDEAPERLEQALRLAADAPLAAQALLAGDGLDFGHSVLAGLLAIATGRPVSSVITEQWQQQAPTTWRWLALWVNVLMKQAHGLTDVTLPGQQRLEFNPDSAALGELWQQALRGIMLARGSARQELLLGKWLLEWERISQSGS